MGSHVFIEICMEVNLIFKSKNLCKYEQNIKCILVNNIYLLNTMQHVILAGISDFS